MGGFDPKAFLAEEGQASTSFDPKAFLAKVEPKTEPAQQEFVSGDPMGGDIGSAIMGEAAPEEPVGKSIFERHRTPNYLTPKGDVVPAVKMEPPPVDYKKNYETMLGSGSSESVMFNPGRQYEQALVGAERGKEKLRLEQQKVNEEKQKRRDAAAGESYGITNFLSDTGVDVGKGLLELNKDIVGLYDLTTGGAAGRIMERLGVNYEDKNKFLTGFQSLTRQNAAANIEETKGFINTLYAMGVNPTELIGSIVQSLPGTVAAGAAGGQYARFLVERAIKEAGYRGLTGFAAKEFITNRVKEQTTKIAAAASAAEGAQTAGGIAETARAQGKEWSEYVSPALNAGFGTTAIGIVSGAAASKLGIGDMETQIAARSAGLKDIGVGKGTALQNIRNEFIKEGILEEMPQSAQEQIFQNIALGKPWDEGVREAAAKGLITGGAMGGGRATFQAAMERAGEIVDNQLTKALTRIQERRGPSTEQYEELARSKGFLGGGGKKSIDQALKGLEQYGERQNTDEQGRIEPYLEQEATPPLTAEEQRAAKEDEGIPDIFGPRTFVENPSAVEDPFATEGAPATTPAAETAPKIESKKFGDFDYSNRPDILRSYIDSTSTSGRVNPAAQIYDRLMNPKVDLASLSKDESKAQSFLKSFNDTVGFLKGKIATSPDPYTQKQSKNPYDAPAEIRELNAIVSQLAGTASNGLNKITAALKGYKGKKAASLDSLNALEDLAEKDLIRAMDILSKTNLLTPDEIAEYQNVVTLDYALNLKNFQNAPAETTVPPTVPFGDIALKKHKELIKKYQEQGFAPEDAKREATVEVQGIPKPPTTPTPYFGSEEINALGDRIKKAVDTLTNNFMVGDMVRYGSTNGTVVGSDATHVRVHPDGAKSPKAYYRVPKSKVELIARPDTVSKTAAMAASDEDKKFGSEQGNLNADMGGLIQLLGANMYGSSIAEVAVKELLQNAFDAVKGAVSSKKSPSLYKSGEITITINGDNRTITIQDNARGMTPEIVRDAFFTIAGSDKSDLDPSERSGGLGLAKMGFMLGSEQLVLDTVRDGVRVIVDTTAKDIADSNFKIVKKPAPKKEHGTTVTVKIPQYYVDPKNGDKKEIFFTGNPKYYDVLKKPLIGPVVVKTIDASYGGKDTETLPIGLNFPFDKYIPFKVKFAWGNADVYFGKDRIVDEYSVKHQVLSSGVYQFDGTGNYDRKFKMSQDEIIPYDIIVNIKPDVEAKHPDYPFENNRERFKSRLEEDISSLSTYLAQIARGNENEDLKENFKNIISMPRIDVGQDIADATGKLHKAFDQRRKTERRELPPMPNEVRIEGTRVIAVDTGQIIADRAKEEEKQTKGTFEAETAAPTREDSMLDMAQNPKLPIFHNNTNVDFLEIGRKYGDPERFFAELGTIMVEMKEALGNSGMYKYDLLKPENLFFGGVSIDKGYGGVHIRVPYKAMLINPFYNFGAKTLFGVREYLWETMTHEAAHTADMSHGVGHNEQMLKVRQYFADEGLADYFRDALMDLMITHESAFTAMREAYGKSTTKNTSKSLKDYEKGSASAQAGGAGGSSEDQLRAVSAGEGPGGYGDIRPVSPAYTTSAVGGGDRTLSTVKGLHASVVAAINKDDITGTLRALAQNTSGLYAELAARLAELNLPSSIGFNNQRSLTHRDIAKKTGQEQVRLFTYIRRALPKIYDKHFTEYDKPESLENVFEGLKALSSMRTSSVMAPVLAELDTVTNAYTKTMPALNAAGTYFPALDAINLKPHPQFGTKNQYLLHEITHAATEYMLRGNPNLTQRQQEAVANLNAMYRYAQTKLSPDEYGFTNIYEFVSEALTNPKFQAKLKGIQYPVEKTSLLNSFIRYVLALFGKDTLAAAAIVEANELFSAARPQGVSTGELRFIRKKGGPISKPDTSRTAESNDTNLIDDLKDVGKGLTPASEFVDIYGKSLLEEKSGQLRRALLPTLSLPQIWEITKSKLIPQIGGANTNIQEMSEYKNSITTEAAKIVKDWLVAKAKNSAKNKLMGNLMIEVTLAGIEVDPQGPSYNSRRDKNGAIVPVPKELSDAWNTLGPDFQSIYSRTRDFYTKSVNRMIGTLKDRANAITDPVERQKVLDDIDEKFGPKNLTAPYFPLRRFGDFWFQVGTGEFKEFYTFESAKARNKAMKKRKYALSKGNAAQQKLAATIHIGSGMSEIYGKNAMTTQVLKDVEDLIENISATDTADLKRQIRDSMHQLTYILLPSQSMRKMFINRQGVQGMSSDMLQVFAHSAIHSAFQQSRFKYAPAYLLNIQNAKEEIKGKRDAGIITEQQEEAYGDFVAELERRFDVMYGANGRGAVEQFASAVTGMTFHWFLSTLGSGLVNTIGATILSMPYIAGKYGYTKTNALFFKNLYRYAATTPTRTLKPLVTTEFYRGLAVGTLGMEFPSIVDSKDLSAVERKFADYYIDAGDLNVSMTNEIFNLADAPAVLYRGIVNNTKKLTSAGFHQMERYTRESTLMTVSVLAYEKYLGAEKRYDDGRLYEKDASGNVPKYTSDEAFDKAIEEARQTVSLTLGDYLKQLRGRIFSYPVLSIPLQFKQYVVSTVFLQGRALQMGFGKPLGEWVNGKFKVLDPELESVKKQFELDKIPPAEIESRLNQIEEYRKELYRQARKATYGMWGMAFLWGGAAATPFFSSIGLVLGAAFAGDDDEDEDKEFLHSNWENDFYRWMQRTFGGAIGATLVKGGVEKDTAQNIGEAIGRATARGVIPELTGASLSERITTDPLAMLWREGRYTKDPRGQILEDVAGNIAGVSLGLNFADAYKLWGQGKKGLAVEKMLPSLFAAPLKSYRLGKEGMTDSNGVVINLMYADEFSKWDVALKAIGISPEREVMARRMASKTVQEQQEIEDQYNNLMNRLFLERSHLGTDEGEEKALEKLQKFIEVYPDLEKNVEKGLEDRAESAAMAEAIGAKLPEKYIPRLSEKLDYVKSRAKPEPKFNPKAFLEK